jgi:hypothetical protein
LRKLRDTGLDHATLIMNMLLAEEVGAGGILFD